MGPHHGGYHQPASWCLPLSSVLFCVCVCACVSVRVCLCVCISTTYTYQHYIYISELRINAACSPRKARVVFISITLNPKLTLNPTLNPKPYTKPETLNPKP